MHKLPFKCPNCLKDATILAIYASAMGEIVVEGQCAPCGLPMHTDTSVMRIENICAQLDFMGSLAMGVSGSVQ